MLKSEARTKTAYLVPTELAIAALDARLLAAQTDDIFSAQAAGSAFVDNEREFSELNMTRMELPWSRNVGSEWSKSFTLRWNVRRSRDGHGSMERAVEMPSCAGKSSNYCRTNDEPGASWNDRRLTT
jgi:hypothetical protein